MATAALFVVSSFLSLCTMEFVLGKFFPVRPLIYQLDARVLYRLIPGSHRFFVHKPGNGGERIPVVINDQGFRGAPITSTKGTELRIVVYGDSFIESEGTKMEDTFTEQLKRLLGGGVEVINAGVVGYGPDQIALRVEDEVAGFAPDLVIVSVFVGNDFGELARNKIFRLDAEGGLVENHPEIGQQLREVFSGAKWAGAKLGTIRAISAAADALRRGPVSPRRRHLGAARAEPTGALLRRYIDESLARQRNDYVEFVEGGNDVVSNIFMDTYDADVAFYPEEPGSLYKRAVMEQILVRIDRTLVAKRTPWLLMIIPDPIDVADHYDISVDPAKYPTHDPTRLTSLLAEMAERNHLQFVSLFDTLHEAPGERLFFRFGDGHWNAAGQKKAAERVATVIAERGLLPRRQSGLSHRLGRDRVSRERQ